MFIDFKYTVTIRPIFHSIVVVFNLSINVIIIMNNNYFCTDREIISSLYNLAEHFS